MLKLTVTSVKYFERPFRDDRYVPFFVAGGELWLSFVAFPVISSFCCAVSLPCVSMLKAVVYAV